MMRARLEPLGAEFISASDVFCNAQGCLTRIGDAAADITVSDQVHITEKGSVFLIASIIDRLLGGSAPARQGALRALTAAAAYLAGFHVENLAAGADIDERGRIGAGHPDLRAELCKFIEQRLAPVGIEMRDDFVEQQ